MLIQLYTRYFPVSMPYPIILLIFFIIAAVRDCHLHRNYEQIQKMIENVSEMTG